MSIYHISIPCNLSRIARSRLYHWCRKSCYHEDHQHLGTKCRKMRFCIRLPSCIWTGSPFLRRTPGTGMAPGKGGFVFIFDGHPKIVSYQKSIGAITKTQKDYMIIFWTVGYLFLKWPSSGTGCPGQKARMYPRATSEWSKQKPQ